MRGQLTISDETESTSIAVTGPASAIICLFGFLRCSTK
jgi:hypothetical protein